MEGALPPVDRSERRSRASGLKLGYSDEDSRESYLGLTRRRLPRKPLAPLRRQPLRPHAVAPHAGRRRPTTRASRDAFTLDAAVYRNDFSRTWRKVNRIGPAAPACPRSSPTPTRRVNADALRRADGRKRHVDRPCAQRQTIYIGPNQREFVSQGAQVVGGWQRADGRRRAPRRGRRPLSLRPHRAPAHGRRLHDAGGQPGPDGEADDRDRERATWAHALALHLTDAATWGPLTLTPGVRVELIDTWERDRLSGVLVQGPRSVWCSPGSASTAR